MSDEQTTEFKVDRSHTSGDKSWPSKPGDWRVQLSVDAYDVLTYEALMDLADVAHQLDEWIRTHLDAEAS